jgi:aspartate aminotransferase-like enzyme
MSPLFVPGAVDVAPRILAAQAKPMLPHRSEEFEAIFHRAVHKAKFLFDTEQHIFLAASAGSGMQEASIRNFISDAVLCCVNGVFADRWHQIAETNQKQAVRLESVWGHEVSADQLANALHKRHFDAVTIVHNESSTGVMSNIGDLAAVVHSISPDTLILVDVISSLGGVEINMDAWGIDFMFSATQMCLGLPPGLSLAAVSERALSHAKTIPDRGWYFDLIRMQKHMQSDSTHSAIGIPLVYALDAQLERVQEEGLENRFVRHAAMAELFQSWAVENDMPPLASEGSRSKTVSVIQNSMKWEFQELNSFLKQRGMQIADGLNILKGETFRVAHMGEITMSDIEDLITAMETFIAHQK